MPDSSREASLRAELGARESERQSVKDRLDRERLTRVTSEMIQAMTSPEFVERVRSARDAADKGAGMEVAAQLLSVEELRRSGVDVPDDFRMTSRVFEDLERGTRIVVSDIPTVGDFDPTVAWGGCAGGGGLSFCGCGGFST
jgi:hypothetical protein